MRHKVELRRVSWTPDGLGGHAEAWRTYATVHAAVEPIRGDESYVGQQLHPGVVYRITTRWRPDIKTEETRVLHDGREYDIRAVYDPDGARRWLVLEVAEVIR